MMTYSFVLRLEFNDETVTLSLLQEYVV